MRSSASSQAAADLAGTPAPALDQNPDDFLGPIDVTAQRMLEDLEVTAQRMTEHYTARPGDSISKIVGSSNPIAIEAFMRRNGLTSSTIVAGREYVMPGPADYAASDGQLGQATLNADNVRLAARAAAAPSEAVDPKSFFGTLEESRQTGQTMQEIAARRAGIAGGASGSWGRGASGSWDAPLTGYEKFSLGVHTTLGVAGMVPVFGAIPDGIDLLFTAVEVPFGASSKLDMGLATAALGANFIPVAVDQAADATKIATRAAEETVAAEKAAPGSWQPVNESMSARAADYQTQISGRTGEAYVVDGVKFDGFDGATLLDAKGPGYGSFVDRSGEFYSWFRGQDSLLRQAASQGSVANGVPIIWHVAEPKAADAMRSLFTNSGVDWVRIVHTPVGQ